MAEEAPPHVPPMHSLHQRNILDLFVDFCKPNVARSPARGRDIILND